MLKAICHFKAN